MYSMPCTENDCTISHTLNKMAFVSTMIAEVRSLNLFLIFRILLATLPYTFVTYYLVDISNLLSQVVP